MNYFELVIEMKIDWEKAEKHPERFIKIKGEDLLELREKINKLMKEAYKNNKKLGRAISFLLE